MERSLVSVEPLYESKYKVNVWRPSSGDYTLFVGDRDTCYYLTHSINALLKYAYSGELGEKIISKSLWLDEDVVYNE